MSRTTTAGTTSAAHLSPREGSSWPAAGRSSAWLAVCGSLLAIGLCSCASPTLQVGTGFGSDPGLQSTAMQSGTVDPTAAGADWGVPVTGAPVAGPPPVPAATAQAQHAQAQYAQAQYTQPAWQQRTAPGAGPVQQVAARQAAAGSRIPPDAVDFSEADARQPLPGEEHDGPGCVKLPCDVNADEYLCDGGDRDYPVTYDDFYRHGLDTEDTIAEWLDESGKNHVTPSNRVCVYAPRFGAMRTISAPISGYSINRLASAADTAVTVGLRSRQNSSSHAKTLPSTGVLVRSRASGIDVDTGQMAFNQRTTLTAHTRLTNVFQDLTFFRTGQMLRSEEARLANATQAAVAWSRDLYPVISATLNRSQQVEARFREAELVGVEDKSTPGKLRIVKLADKKTASPGDVVTFTIRYDNLGDREVAGINIVDNLTPRLEYVEDSATSDREGRLVVEENGEGSLVLTFEIEDPLPGKTGGVVTFKARVR